MTALVQPAPVVLREGWEICAVTADAIADPAQLPPFGQPPWLAVPHLGTAAAILRDRGEWSLDGPARRFDAQDWWYTCTLPLPAGAEGSSVVLGLDGLATLTEVWIDGVRVLESRSMHLAHRLSVPLAPLERTVRLVLAFRSLDAALARRRPRPRWRTPMVEHQQLRWWRTTLIGRTPGWTPPVAPVGPWRPIWLALPAPGLALEVLELYGSVTGADGLLHLRARVTGAVRPARCRLRLQTQGAGASVQEFDWQDPGDGLLEASVTVPAVQLWWPHTHGPAVLYDCMLDVSDPVDGSLQSFALGRTGFRCLALDRREEHFSLRVNDVKVFCRGACWTPIDVVSLNAGAAALEHALTQVRTFGFNMLRLSGALVYESSEFFAICDRLGILVWQDFMFANMDYPDSDGDFVALAVREAEQELARWSGHPSLAVVCGNSEASQQAAMWGAGRSLWASSLFTQTLDACVRARCPGVPYWPSSAFGGDFPHQVDRGTTSYYGVGAYLRPLSDARLSGLRFATESLAFANIPEAAAIARMPGGTGLRVHHAGWKARTCRDLNAGWDFEDVRDHYLQLLHGVDPMRLRYADHERYLMLSRVVSGQVMARSMVEWRRPESTCGGALIWYLRDFWAGAGWGLLDDAGEPKACAWILRRALQPTCVSVTDEGNNGLYLHVVHDAATPVAATLEVGAFDAAGLQRWSGSASLVLTARSSLSIPLMRLSEQFEDFSHAFRFGPRTWRSVAVALHGEGRVLSECVWYPDADPTSMPAPEPRITAVARPGADGRWEIVIQANALACHVHVVDANFRPSDQYFDLAPGATRILALQDPAPGEGQVPRGYIAASNLAQPVPIARGGDSA